MRGFRASIPGRIRLTRTSVCLAQPDMANVQFDRSYPRVTDFHLVWPVPSSSQAGVEIVSRVREMMIRDLDSISLIE